MSRGSSSRTQALRSLEGWRQLPLSELEELILVIRRDAGRGVHLDEREWRLLDRMRTRAAALAMERVS
jgi:hypothetical protein